MNEFIITRFNHYHQLLIENPVIARFIVLKQNVTSTNGRIRVRATLTDAGLLEFAEYIALDKDETIVVHTYAFHWQEEKTTRATLGQCQPLSPSSLCTTSYSSSRWNSCREPEDTDIRNGVGRNCKSH